MSVFQADLWSHITTDTTLGGLIGERLYPNDAPIDTPTPFVVYYEFANPLEQTLPGPVAVERPRIQYSTYAATYGEALEVTTALKARLLDGTWPVLIEDERGTNEVTSAVHRRDLDVRISHV